MLTDHIAIGTNVSDAWLAATELLARRKGSAYHLIVAIQNPFSEVDGIRSVLDHLYESDDFARFKYPVESVASTIFPKHLATRSNSPNELAREYRKLYPFLRRFRSNRFGTYFGRISEEPPGGGVDQLNRTIEKLSKNPRYKACYEIDMSRVQDIGIYEDSRDRGSNRCRGFPCLSHVSFQVDPSRHLHTVAYYRSHDVISKAYGNYLGLGRLAKYIAQHCNLELGQLTAVAGHAFIDPKLRAAELRELLKETRAIISTS